MSVRRLIIYNEMKNARASRKQLRSFGRYVVGNEL